MTRLEPRMAAIQPLAPRARGGARGEGRARGLSWQEWALGALLLVLLLGLLFVEQEERLKEVNRAVGIVLVALGLRVAYRQGWRAIGIEHGLFAAFVVWSWVSGALVAQEPALVWDYTRTLAQTWALGIAVSAAVFRRRDPSLALLPFVACGLVLLGFSLGTGEIGSVREASYQQATSLTRNPNTLGIYALYGIVAVASSWRGHGRGRWRALALSLALPGLVLLIGLSASRKSVASLAVFMGLWLAFCGRYVGRKKVRGVAVAAVMVAALAVFTKEQTTDTFRKRMENTMRDPYGDTSRYELFMIGMELFVEQPVAGIGLGNFPTRSGTGQYSHSDYSEVLSTTGAVGGLLYFSIYVILWRRWSELSRLLRRPEDLYCLGVYRATLVTTLVLGIGAANFLSPWHWVIILAMASHARTLTRAPGFGAVSSSRSGLAWRAKQSRAPVVAGAGALPGSGLLPVGRERAR